MNGVETSSESQAPSLKLAGSVDPIDAAIESAESLIASLLVRERSSSLQQADGGLPNGQDPEGSLFSPIVDQSLVTEGSASLWPTTLTASSQATVPEHYSFISPKESLHALGSFIYNYIYISILHQR